MTDHLTGSAIDGESGDETSLAPYENSREHVLDELERIDLLLWRRLQIFRAEMGQTADEYRGFYVSDEEVDRLLGVTRENGHVADAMREDRELLDRIEAQTERIRRRERLTREAGRTLRLDAVVDRFDLENRHRDALVLALAPEIDRKYERIYAYLQDDLTQKRPTVDLILRVVARSEQDRLEARRAFSRRSPLRRHRLVELTKDDNSPLLSCIATVDGHIVDYLLGGDGVDDRIGSFSELDQPTRTLKGLPLDVPRRERLERLAQPREESEPRRMTLFYGPYGSGKDAAVEAVCTRLARPLLRADAERAAWTDVPAPFQLLVREARLHNAALHLANLDALVDRRTDDPPSPSVQSSRSKNAEFEFRHVFAQLESFDHPVFLTAEERLGFRTRGGPTVPSVEFPTPDYERRRELWNEVEALPDFVDTADLAAKFRLTDGQISDAVAAATVETDDGGLSEEAVYAACRAQSRSNLDVLAQRTNPTYGWGDIVLPSETMSHLREVAAQITHRETVSSTWGFGTRFSLGNGLILLFTGRSGTGKTMAAEIIANDAGLDLYKVDLSSVVSKYIGETETNLGRIFDEAANSDAILLFDEADALFGKRTQVGDAHDRYANVEVNYLLQRIEEHDGTVILTTNLEGNIDDAFRRRIHCTVDFPRPDEEAREAIWRGIFPAATPVGDVDYAFLAGFDLTGGTIKNVALTAAYLAAAGDETVRMKHLVRALKREFQKSGGLISPGDFGEYWKLVE